MATVKIPLDMVKIAAFCQRGRITSLALFGSVLRDDFRPDSDVDVLVVFAPDVRYTLFDLMEINLALAELLGRNVDLLERSWVEKSHNPIRRRAILESAEEVYRAAA